MGLFRKKKEAVSASNSDQMAVRILTIPDVFHGGHDPVIYHTPQREGTKSTPPESKTISSTPTVHQPLITKKKLIFVGATLVLLIAVGASAVYFIQKPNTNGEVVIVPDEVPPPPPPEAPTTTEEIIPDVLVTNTTSTDKGVAPTTTLSLEPQPLVFPSIFLTNSTDLDADELTDIEEEVYDTDTAVWDTDQDGYYDGQEVVNLYNPSGIAPIKLVDSGLIEEYVNPTWQYRLYYPNVWQVGAVDTAANHILISAITGDYIEVRAMPKKTTESFADWFGQTATGQSFTGITSTTSRFKETIFIRNDGLVAYSVDDSVVYVLIYHPGTTGNISFRHTMKMIVQSFRKSKTFVPLPEQVQLPPTPTTTPT